ncbi:hypothetical protein QWZ16_24285 [Vibrio ostreicida]|uniref:Uncharacterized protein n=1 Tax=Vibrio ostreicida TaxID=526588 RepID=A0ABT8BXP6_9VIBR|nr:hypothetical protein [Vibrio ostreicida]MDN3611793.1 hypothetical protein [Vibrio ostreicida]MDN3612702.1 hypothetical protein [Vibrio ostreicida]
MKSDSWLSKNIRLLAASTIILAYLTICILDSGDVDLIEPWLDLLKHCL